MAALQRVKTNRESTRQHTPGKERPVPAVGEAREWSRVRPAVFHCAGPCSTVADMAGEHGRSERGLNRNPSPGAANDAYDPGLGQNPLSQLIVETAVVASAADTIASAAAAGRGKTHWAGGCAARPHPDAAL